MITSQIRTAVSIAAVTATLALAACAGGPSPSTWDGTAEIAEQRAIRFENEAQTYVDVYLVDFANEQRQWWLGRVAPGALTTLRIPDGRLPVSGYMRLAVLAGIQRTGQAARDSRAILTIAQPGAAILSQRWTFRQPQLAAPELFGAPVRAGRS